ncbi:MAG: RidA family protein [Leptolyngbya sp.]|nr:RidA family protein [Candidatus Melainabacteria bacterium]
MTATQSKGRIQINPGGSSPKALGSYSHAIQVGAIVFVAGQGCRDAKSGIEAGIIIDEAGKVTSYDIEVQTRGVIKNLETVLLAAGLTLADVIDATVFLKNMSDFEKYNKVWSEFFTSECPPARTTVGVADLPGRNYIEIKAIAQAKETKE